MWPAWRYVLSGSRVPPRDGSGPERPAAEPVEAVGEVVRPRPARGDPKDVSSSVADEDAGCVEERVAEPFRFRGGELVAEGQGAGPGEEVAGRSG